jgi:signal transduction histidine kinase
VSWVSRQRPPLLDIALALALAAFVQLEVWGTDVTTPKAIAVSSGLLMTVPLAWRRLAPLGTAMVVNSAWAAEALLDNSEQQAQSTLLGLVLAAYSVAAYAERPRAIAGLLLALTAALVVEAGDLIVMGPFFVGVWLAGRLFRDRQRLAAALQSRTEVLEREQHDSARLAIAHERARIARELHDVVAHSVTVMVVQAGAERLALRDEAESTREVLRSIERTGRQALTEMRRLLGMLREEDDDTTLAPQPGLAHLEALVERVREAGLPVELRIEGQPRQLPAGVDISAYRIVQEALTNTLRHAGAGRADVVVRYGDGELRLKVEDDGRGAVNRNGGGHGLVGMRERATLYGGDLQAGNAAGGGFVVRAQLPFEESRA